MIPEDFFGKDYLEFDMQDPFNGNQVHGYISRGGIDLYGALLIDYINGESCPQLIRCTPKMRYPFDKQGKWNFPKAKRIERYEKLDGTNIFAYRYKNHDGDVFVAYKTRLLAFVGDSRFGPFRSMLQDILSANPALMGLPSQLDMNISYELWGAKNPHLVKYETPLELSILFGRDGEKIIPPSAFKTNGFPVAPMHGAVTRDSVDAYQLSQREMESRLSDTGDGYYTGIEGEVWYLQTEDGLWQQFKCKPESIELIHWSIRGIGKNQIITTCENAFENYDNPTVENIAELLLEEFPQHEIDKVHYRIGTYLGEVIERHLFMELVMANYREIGVNILEDKQTVMKALSDKYRRNEMQAVFSIIMAHVGD